MNFLPLKFGSGNWHYCRCVTKGDSRHIHLYLDGGHEYVPQSMGCEPDSTVAEGQGD